MTGEPRPSRAGWMFVAPALLVIGIFFLLPVGAGLLLSLLNFDIYSIGDPSTVRFIGLRNYAVLFRDPTFGQALRNTALFVFIGLPLTILPALGAALLVNSRRTRFPSLFRTVFFAPVVTTLVAVAVVWRALYHPRFGLINQALTLAHLPPIDWLGDPRWSLPAIILLASWKNFGYGMVIFVAALKNMSPEVFEAARIDGASAFRQFLHITLPLLRPALVFVSFITAVGYFQLFAEPYVMTLGGPLNSTLSVALMMYREGFRWWNLGYAAAIAVVLFAIILAVSLVGYGLQRRRSA
jgi:multiple sugar transport system permease protein